MKLVRALAVPLLLATTTAVAAVEPDALQRLFPYQAEVDAEGAGLCRLPLPAEVRAHCRADLSDLRLLDDENREIPYLLLAATAGQTRVEILEHTTPAVRDAVRNEERSRSGPVRFHERYTLDVPPLPAESGRWDLVLDVAWPEFVARLDLVAVTADGRRVPVLDAGSTFRLRQPVAERRRFQLPREVASLEVALTSESGRYLAPSFELEAVRHTALPGASQVPLTILDRPSRAGRTELVVERPRGLVATTLRLQTSTGAFRRPLTVWDEGPGAAEDPLGATVLLRIDALAPVEVLEVPVTTPRGDRLRLVIDDGDSPPLQNVTVSALVPQPVLFFSLPGGTTHAVLRFGGARAHRPRYDLAALAPVLGEDPIVGDAAARALPFVDATRSRRATLGPIVANPEWDPQPALAFAMNPGAPLDPAPFSHRRHLVVKPSEEGLSRLRLSPEDLALLRPDLADLRVVDSESRQWAYLLEPRTETALMSAEIRRHRVTAGRSRYELRPPVQPMAVEWLELQVEMPFFDRAYRLLGTTPDHREVQLAAGRFVRHQGDPRPPTITVPGTRLELLTLEVEDGDDAPLEIAEVLLATPVAELYLASPAAELTLLLGDPDGVAPRYELARVRSTVLAVPSLAITAGPLEPNPTFSASARLRRGRGPQRLLLWVALGVAVAALGLLTLRLARQSPE